MRAPLVDGHGRTIGDGRRGDVTERLIGLFRALVAGEGTPVVERVPTWKWMERVSRKICVEYGTIASTCPSPAHQVALLTCPDTLDRIAADPQLTSAESRALCRVALGRRE